MPIIYKQLLASCCSRKHWTHLQSNTEKPRFDQEGNHIINHQHTPIHFQISFPKTKCFLRISLLHKSIWYHQVNIQWLKLFVPLILAVLQLKSSFQNARWPQICHNFRKFKRNYIFTWLIAYFGLLTWSLIFGWPVIKNFRVITRSKVKII